MAAITTTVTASASATVKSSPLAPPQLKGVIPPLAERYIRQIQQAYISLQAELKLTQTQLTAALNGQLSTQGQTTIIQLVNKALQHTGSAPLDITGLPGIVGQPQPSGNPIVTSLPVAGDPLFVIGTQVIFNGLPWILRASLTPGGPPFWVQMVSTTSTLQGTHVSRSGFNPQIYPVGTQFYETDRTVSYLVQDIGGGVHAWLFYNGIFEDVLANIPTDLGVDDINFQFRASDYLQTWTWDGSGWHFSAGSQSNYYVSTNTGFPPNGGLWGKADGSTYLVSQDDATTASVISINFAGDYLRR